MNSIIQKYPKIFKPYQGNPGDVNWNIPLGWFTIVDLMCECIQWYVDNNVTHTKDGQIRPPQPECIQIKEKFGGLRFYTTGHDNVVDGMIRLADYMCCKTCVYCSSMKDVEVTNKGWIQPICKKCRERNI